MRILPRTPAVIPRLAWHSRIWPRENAPRSCCCRRLTSAGLTGQPEAVVSAMNRSGSAISSSTAHRSSSNRARRSTNAATSAELAESPGPAGCQRYLPSRSRMRSRQATCRPRDVTRRSSEPRSSSPFLITVAKPPAAATLRRMPATSMWVGRRALLRRRPARRHPSALPPAHRGCAHRASSRASRHGESPG